MNKTFNQIKNILIATSKSITWLGLYIIYQFIGLFLVITSKIYLFNDEDFINKFIDAYAYTLEPLTFQEFTNESIIAANKLISNFYMEILLINSILFVATYIIYKLKTNKSNKKITINNIGSNLSNAKNFLTKSIDESNIKIIINCIILGLFLNISIEAILMLLPPNIINNYDQGIEATLSGSFPMLIIVGGIITPICEEILFRYIIPQTIFNKLGNTNKNYIVSIILASFYFGVIHGNLVQGTYAFLLGIVFCLLNKKYEKKIVSPSSIVHITINCSSIIVGQIGNSNNYMYILIFFLVFSIVYLYSCFYIKKIIQNKRFCL